MEGPTSQHFCTFVSLPATLVGCRVDISDCPDCRAHVCVHLPLHTELSTDLLGLIVLSVFTRYPAAKHLLVTCRSVLIDLHQDRQGHL